MTADSARASAELLPCQQVDPEVFFAESPARIGFAKALCGNCPRRRECLETALLRGEAAGVWGGELLIDGRIVAHKRGRGRPRKHPRTEPEAGPRIGPNPLHQPTAGVRVA